MHIPSCESQKLSILSFDEALLNSGSRGDYDADKWLYVPDYYADYRYILGTKGENPLICIGINPSTAAPDDLDNTEQVGNDDNNGPMVMKYIANNWKVTPTTCEEK